MGIIISALLGFSTCAAQARDIGKMLWCLLAEVADAVFMKVHNIHISPCNNGIFSYYNFMNANWLSGYGVGSWSWKTEIGNANRGLCECCSCCCYLLHACSRSNMPCYRTSLVYSSLKKKKKQTFTSFLRLCCCVAILVHNIPFVNHIETWSKKKRRSSHVVRNKANRWWRCHLRMVQFTTMYTCVYYTYHHDHHHPHTYYNVVINVVVVCKISPQWLTMCNQLWQKLSLRSSLSTYVLPSMVALSWWLSWWWLCDRSCTHHYEPYTYYYVAQERNNNAAIIFFLRILFSMKIIITMHCIPINTFSFFYQGSLGIPKFGAKMASNT